MIKVECNRGIINVGIEGTGITIMAELCVIVDTVCEKLTEDEEDAKEYKYIMMVQVANALKKKANALKRKAKDDTENRF